MFGSLVSTADPGLHFFRVGRCLHRDPGTLFLLPGHEVSLGKSLPSSGSLFSFKVKGSKLSEFKMVNNR